MALQEKKSEMLTQQLEQALKLRKLQYVSRLNANEILISWSATPTQDQPNILIKIQPRQDDTGAIDALGMQQRVYSPHMAEVMFEEDSEEPGEICLGSNYAETFKFGALLATLTFELARAGLRQSYWIEDSAAHAGPINSAAWATAKKLQTPDLGDMQWPLVGDV